MHVDLVGKTSYNSGDGIAKGLVFSVGGWEMRAVDGDEARHERAACSPGERALLFFLAGQWACVICDYVQPSTMWRLRAV